MASDAFKELTENPEYQKILAKMSDEERKIAEKAAQDLFEQFERNVILPLKNSFKK
jgi:hypothetical protein